MRKPKGFHEAADITWSELSPVGPHFVRPVKLTAKLQAGITYENAVHEHFDRMYGDQYVPGPWLKFVGRNKKMRWCQPDALLIDLEANCITIVECKYKHIARSWWQLHRLYLPVIQHLFGPKWTYRLAEVSKWCDPATPYPGATPRIMKLENCYDLPATNLLCYQG